MKKVAFSIIIPTKDEREHISTTIGSICATMIDESFEILIVYDSNKDNTLPVIRKLKQKYHQLKITKNCFLGLAGAIKTGVKKSRGKYIITLSADDSAPIQSLPMAIKLSKKYDFLSGTRYRMGGKRINGSLIGKILSERKKILPARIVGIGSKAAVIPIIVPNVCGLFMLIYYPVIEVLIVMV